MSCCDHGAPNSASLRSSQSVARPVSSDPSLPLTSCPVDRRKRPRFLGLLQGCCGVFTSHPCSFGSAVPCPKGRITNVKIYLEPNWPSPPPLLSMGSLHCVPVPQPFPEQCSPRGQFSCSQTHAPMNFSLCSDSTVLVLWITWLP